MKYENIGKVYFDVENKVVGRKPTKSNVLETHGSDNDIYLCNVSQIDVIDKLKNIIGFDDVNNYNGKRIMMNFYGLDVEIIFNINSQGRVSFRLTGRNRLYGMIKYVNETLNFDLDTENIAIMFDFVKYNIYFCEIDKINTI